jgi:hypothetical protein
MNIFVGEKSWRNYVVSVKARKVSGREGFVLVCRAKDERNFVCLNVGGWGNTKAGFGATVNGTFSEVGESTPFKVEADKWYEVKIEVRDEEAAGYVDGQAVAKAEFKAAGVVGGGAGGSGGPGSGSRGGGISGGVTAVAKPMPTTGTFWDRALFVGGAAILAGLVTGGVVWLRGRVAGRGR